MITIKVIFLEMTSGFPHKYLALNSIGLQKRLDGFVFSYLSVKTMIQLMLFDTDFPNPTVHM